MTKLYNMKAWVLAAALLISGASMAQKKKNWDNYLPMSTIGIGVGFQEFDGLNNRIANQPLSRRNG